MNMKRPFFMISFIAIMVAIFAFSLTATAAPPEQAATPTDIVIGPANTTPTPTVAPLGTQPANGSSIQGTAVATAPAYTVPPTLADLIKQYPDLQPYLDKVKNIAGKDLDFSELYAKILEIYKDKGATGVGAFIKDSGILEKLGIPLSYLDLLNVYDKGGFDAVKKLATDRKIINDKNEVVGYLAVDDPNNLDSVMKDLDKLGVTTYGFLDDSEELEIGIPLDLLGQYQTPDTLLKFLVSVAQVNHVVGFRAPTPVLKSEPALQKAKITVGAKTVGADKWIAAGATGKGIKVGILDMGFGGINAALGKALPAKVTANTDLSELDAQDEDHGTACAEIVHGIAPDADLYIAYFDGQSETSFTDALDFLQKNNVQILSYSVGSVIGPRDGTFGTSVTADQFTKDTGALWVAAAGNDGDGHTRFTYTDDGQGNNVFGKDKKGNAVTLLPFKAGIPQTDIAMDWDGSWSGKEKNEYDISVLDKDGNVIGSAAELRKGRKNDFPFQDTEVDTTPGEVYFIAVSSPKGATGATIDIFVHNGYLPDWALVPGYSISSPGDSDSVLTVGATGLTQDTIEDYSSQGPTTDERIKPDISAPTGEKLQLSGFEDGFFGTSGSTPLVAGAAALVLQVNPDFTAPQIKAYLLQHIKDLGDKGPDDVFGAGRLALGAPDVGGNGGGDNGNGSTGGDVTSTPSKGGGNTSSGSASATISSTDVKFNVSVKGKKGIKATISFEVDGFKGKPGAVAILFFDKDGKTSLTPNDPNFTIGDTIGTGSTFTPKQDVATYADSTLFIPNTALVSLKGKKQITYIVGILDLTDKTKPQILAASDPTLLNIK